jgi:hypothetical protein
MPFCLISTMVLYVVFVIDNGLNVLLTMSSVTLSHRLTQSQWQSWLQRSRLIVAVGSMVQCIVELVEDSQSFIISFCKSMAASNQSMCC